MDRETAPHFVRIWADSSGVSHLEDVVLPTTSAGAERGVPTLTVADVGEVGRLQIADILHDDFDPDWHTAPRPQYVVFLTGWARIEVGDGEVRQLEVGSIVLAEDLHGRGHVTSHEPGPQRVLVIPKGDVGY